MTLDLSRYDGHTPGKWDWLIHDHSMASLGVLPDPGLDDPLVMAIGPCGACADRADPKVWEWDRCRTPTEVDARLLADAPLLLAEVVRLREVVRLQDIEYLQSIESADKEIAELIHVGVELRTEIERLRKVLSAMRRIARDGLEISS